MSFSLATTPVVLLLISILCVAHVEAKALKYHAEILTNDYGVLNSNDPTEHKDCGSLLRAGYGVSGVYRLTINKKYVMMPCEFQGGKAFTVILRRLNGSLSFAQSWKVYEAGFGHPQTNFWAGLDNIFHLTNSGVQKGLQVKLQDFEDVKKTVGYSLFRLDGKETQYRLNVGGFSGTLADELDYQNQMPFSTFDKPDLYGCAATIRAGFWYNDCTDFLPTGHYYDRPFYRPSGPMFDGIYYKDWHTYEYSFKSVSLAVTS